tara:strand:- start:164 stop:619 length:456 start_codon:yes stop_codon:yes gene_type:complete
MNLCSLISKERISLNIDLKSKKKMLQYIAMLFSEKNCDINKNLIFDALINREKLGPTSVGKGVAIPHCRFDGCKEPLCAVVTLKNPINYDSKDNEKVDLIWALIVPKEYDNKHLEILSLLSKHLMEIDFCESIRKSYDPKSLYNKLIQYKI